MFGRKTKNGFDIGTVDVVRIILLSLLTDTWMNKSTHTLSNL